MKTIPEDLPLLGRVRIKRVALESLGSFAAFVVVVITPLVLLFASAPKIGTAGAVRLGALIAAFGLMPILAGLYQRVAGGPTFGVGEEGLWLRPKANTAVFVNWKNLENVVLARRGWNRFVCVSTVDRRPEEELGAFRSINPIAVLLERQLGSRLRVRLADIDRSWEEIHAAIDRARKGRL